jgi:hypothetical protein
VRYVRQVIKRVRGKRVVPKLPGTPSLKLTGPKRGAHAEGDRAVHKTVKRKGPKVTVSVFKTLKASFSVC